MPFDTHELICKHCIVNTLVYRQHSSSVAMTSCFGVVQEDALLLLAHQKHGNKWIEIAKMVGGRSVLPTL